ncbi:hypothetical protein ACR80S_12085 [Halomonas sp. MA07-2]|uniref:hypothetical protein n=1 Tax=unclassified Halomonas TaxID=2609666 RepID=UPI003EE90B71
MGEANIGDALLAAALDGQEVIYQPTFIVGDALARGALVALWLDQPPLDLGELHDPFPPTGARPRRCGG